MIEAVLTQFLIPVLVMVSILSIAGKLTNK